ncbi:endolytic transglycosylase MltG [Leucobacter ruminantium]|uniref:Endolytic murein transglycosylase n=1 Tax=Leucobacter ruminantium TaxID=1289170 RepID=A0A939LTP9_9MICO|nr:endolytic transglycosylase MltG [Leucobacter ruminantium]MBO1804640.1 endolytic transglycosylase MltG [Leucobacter ruminantium]
MNARSEGSKRRGKRIAITLVVLAVLLGGLAAAGGYLWSQFGDRISLAMGWTSNDYEGEGHGEVLITVTSGQVGADVADTLAEADVVKTSDAFYELLLEQDPQVDFQVGTYRMKQQMSSQAALDALQDPANLMELTVTIPEGMAAKDALQRASDILGIPMEEFDAAIADPAAFGIPAQFPSVEGFLFPATYTFEPEDTAHSVVQKMVDRMRQALAEHGVAQGDEWRVLTLASVVQREAGSNLDDFPKIARVFQNRLDQGVLLQSDATVAYGTGNTHTVWTTPEERADASNRYNTYANPGLPVGPIGNPGDVAIDAAVHPADGPWMFFMPINLETGETVFSETAEQHEESVARLGEWCEAHRSQGGTRCD